MSIGVCYFPEHWPRERWEDDVERMAEAGIEYVRMAEFSWAVLEPEPGEFDFEWLDTAVELIGDRGMKAVLCTPTATPPKWLVDEHPDVLQEEADGTVREFGSRRHYCFNSETYREESRRIVERMAERYADDPHVAGWQTDNEYGCHGTTRCYCDDCASAFREWLAEKYGDVESLNDAWGTTFWSQRYTSFEEVDPPRHTVTDHHPSRLLDYYRFASESVTDYNRMQTDLLREADDDWFVTHNFMGDFDTVDAYDVCGDLDFASWDSYPTLWAQRQSETTPTEYRVGDVDQVAMNHSLYRVAGGGPFWVMEQQSGDIRAFPHSPEPPEGAMRMWAHHAAAHGGDVVSYFRWRRCREGQEQYWGGLNNYDGSPDRGLPEAAAVAGEMADLPAPADVEASVALLHDYDNLWAINIEPHSPDFDYWDHARTWFSALRARGVGVDVVHPSADLSGYDAVVAPTLHLVTDGLADRLAAYVEGGGELLLTVRSGMKDEHDKTLNELAPGPLSETAGVRVEQFESLPEDLETRVTYGGEEYDYRTWGEWLVPEGAEVAGEHASGVADGEPAIAHNASGDGHAAYCGVWPSADLADAVVADLLDRAGVDAVDRLPEGVRLTERDGLTYVVNFGPDAATVAAPDDAEFVLGGESVDAQDVAVVDAPAADLDVGR